jgi:aminoglycoside phosphotransferase (APT) family kinase protein
MSSRSVVADFLNRKAWHLVQYIDLGTTAHIFVVEKGGKRHVLKIRRDGNSDTCALRAEHQVLQYLNATVMQQYVPRVGEWLQELDGFLMEYLRYPTRAERDAKTWRPSLAQALQALHSISLPAINGIANDHPEIGTAIGNRFRSMFQIVRKEDSFWTRLPGKDKSKLECVRVHYETYMGLLLQIEDTLAHTKPALTHGDLAGDNIMLTQDGRLAIADWGAARISSALTDVAHLLTYTNWSGDEEHQFLSMYFSDDLASLAEALPCLQILSRLYRYHSCVQSLLWLNEMGKVGLDAVGRAHFERMLGTL